MLSKIDFTRPISGQVVLIPNNDTWMIFKIAYPKYFSLFLQYSEDKRPSEEFYRGGLNRFWLRALLLEDGQLKVLKYIIIAQNWPLLGQKDDNIPQV